MTRPVGRPAGLLPAAPRRHQADLAEHRNVDQRRAAGPRCAAVQPLGRAPDCQHGFPGDQCGLGEAHHHRAGQHGDRAVLLAALAREHRGRKRMVQHQRPGGEQPGQDHAGDARERCGGERAKEHGVGLVARLEVHRKACRHELRVAARDRNDAVRRDVEGEQRDVIGGRALAFDRRRLVIAFEDVVERNDAVGQVLAEAAQEADGEGLGRDMHREVAVHDVPDPLAADQRARRDAAERRRRIGMPPEQRERCGDQPGAHHGEQRDHAFHRVGKLDRHHGVGRQPELAQSRRERRDGAVCLRIAEPAHRSVGEGGPVGRVDQRWRVGPARKRAAEQIVEGRLRGGIVVRHRR